MDRRKVIIVSPREPSGATWLINCCLELSILIYRVSEANMWRKEGEEYFLCSNENILKQWLPALTHYNSFTFRQDIEIEWVHDWPKKKFMRDRILYFVRDPRDALYSRFKRENPDLSYAEYAAFLDHQSLLNKIDNWYFFNKCWLARDHIKFFRFEDYKKNPGALLKNILNYIGIDASENEILNAVERSSFEKAKETERAYKEERMYTCHPLHPEEKQVINRGGTIGSWKDLQNEDAMVTKAIEDVCRDVLIEFGYIDGQKTAADLSEYVRHLKMVPFFDEVISVGMVHEHKTPNESRFAAEIAKFALMLHPDLIKRSKIYTGELAFLFDNLAGYFSRCQFHLLNLAPLCQERNNKKEILYQLYKTILKNNGLTQYIKEGGLAHLVKKAVRSIMNRFLRGLRH